MRLKLELPRSFGIAYNQHHPLWKDYVKWVNRKYSQSWTDEEPYNLSGTPELMYLGYSVYQIDFNGTFYQTKEDLSFIIEILTLEEWDEIKNNKEKNQELMKGTKIKMSKMLNVIEGIYNNEEIRKTCIPIFMGNPGIGKSRLIEQFAEEKGVNLVSFIASQRLPNEISGISMPDTVNELMKFFDYDTFLNLKDGDIVLFDELLNANPMVLNAMLTMLENRCMISGKKLPNIMFLAASNWQGATMVTPQIKERFIYYDVEFDRHLWGRYMYKKYDLVDQILEDLCIMIEGENFKNSEVNYNTPRSFDKAINMILHDIDTPYDVKIKSILGKLIENPTDKSIQLGDLLWLPKEKISWLKMKQKQLKIK